MIGLTLEHLHAQSTNSSWEPSFIESEQQLIYKVDRVPVPVPVSTSLFNAPLSLFLLYVRFRFMCSSPSQLVDLKNFSVYWNTNDKPLSFSSSAELKQRLEELLFRTDTPPPPHQYLLHPVCGTLKVPQFLWMIGRSCMCLCLQSWWSSCMNVLNHQCPLVCLVIALLYRAFLTFVQVVVNKSDIPDMEIPKYTLNFLFDRISFVWDEAQYRDLLELQDSFERYARGYKVLLPNPLSVIAIYDRSVIRTCVTRSVSEIPRCIELRSNG